jgi:hypothetical protein
VSRESYRPIACSTRQSRRDTTRENTSCSGLPPQYARWGVSITCVVWSRVHVWAREGGCVRHWNAGQEGRTTHALEGGRIIRSWDNGAHTSHFALIPCGLSFYSSFLHITNIRIALAQIHRLQDARVIYLSVHDPGSSASLDSSLLQSTAISHTSPTNIGKIVRLRS